MNDGLTQLPADKQAAVLREFGEKARAWIEGFPDLVQTCVDRWNLTLLDTASAGLPINMIWFAEDAGGNPVVLKVGHPHPEQITEMIALRHYDGRCTPRLIDCSETLGATLMERIRPGATFRSSADCIERSRVSLEIFSEISTPADAIEGLPTFDDWIGTAFARYRAQFDGDHFYRHHVDMAEAVYATLRADHPDNWMLHGDLHHENLLEDEERGWVAIDPKGVIGPRPMEIGRFLHNFPEDEIEGASSAGNCSVEQVRDVFATRVSTFADMLGWPRETVLRVGYIDCVLSFCWTINSGGTGDGTVRVDAMRTLLDEQGDI